MQVMVPQHDEGRIDHLAADGAGRLGSVNDDGRHDRAVEATVLDQHEAYYSRRPDVVFQQPSFAILVIEE